MRRVRLNLKQEARRRETANRYRPIQRRLLQWTTDLENYHYRVVEQGEPPSRWVRFACCCCACAYLIADNTRPCRIHCLSRCTNCFANCETCGDACCDTISACPIYCISSPMVCIANRCSDIGECLDNTCGLTLARCADRAIRCRNTIAGNNNH